jgi:hypothetical protein
MNDVRKVVDNTLVPHSAFIGTMRRLTQCFDHVQDSGEPIGLAVIGESRTGKSRVLEEFYVKHPRCRTEEGMEIPIIRVKTQSKPTVKSFVELLLHNMGDPRSSTGTENRKTNRLLELMQGASTRMIMVDEFQHFYDKVSHKVMHHVADWLKNVVDEAKVALVVSGIPTCRAVLDQNEQLAGRFLAPAVMPRLLWTADEQREEFFAILAAFHESMSQYFDLPVFDHEETAFRFYCGTGGLIGYLVKMLKQAVWNALDDGARVISFEDLAKAHHMAVWEKQGFGGIAPFDREVILAPNTRLLSAVRKIGVALDDAEAGRADKGLNKKKWTANEVLSAR